MFGFKDSATEHNDIWLKVNIDVGFLDWSNSNNVNEGVGFLIGSALTQKGLFFVNNNIAGADWLDSRRTEIFSWVKQ